MRREQLGAVPSTLTTDRCAFTTTCEPASAGSGAATSRARVGARPPNTSGKPLVSTVSRSAVGQRLRLLPASPGRSPSSSALLRTALASQGSDDEPSGTATSQATSSTANSDTNAPPTSSSRCGRPGW